MSEAISHKRQQVTDDVVRNVEHEQEQNRAKNRALQRQRRADTRCQNSQRAPVESIAHAGQRPHQSKLDIRDRARVKAIVSSVNLLHCSGDGHGKRRDVRRDVIELHMALKGGLKVRILRIQLAKDRHKGPHKADMAHTLVVPGMLIGNRAPEQLLKVCAGNQPVVRRLKLKTHRTHSQSQDPRLPLRAAPLFSYHPKPSSRRR